MKNIISFKQGKRKMETNGMIEIPAGKIREYENIFSALRREAWEETGLKITKIYGEDLSVYTQTGNVSIFSFQPFCITQNLSGAYSIILNTFLCEAEGNLIKSTNETENVHWIRTVELRQMLNEQPEKMFYMHINALKKYFDM